ncbi:MAG: outer membrane beta-barrel protein [Prevotellaceae bacterium]|nr:outer membrane beta-barrel protein [Prevotellaceae bacterium]
MRYKCFFFLAIMVIGFGLHAQDKVSIIGSVRDGKGPIEQATVQILNVKDSSNIIGVTTGKDGSFNINAVAGDYILKTSFLGYIDNFRLIKTTGTRTVLESVVLEKSYLILDTAIIFGAVPEMVIKGDTIEYNADSYKVLPSAVVEDLIKKLPGAEVDSEGKITINGKEIKKIYVDKKEFFSTDPKVASRNLPAAMVDKVQVWDKRSDMAEMTGFDDGEEESVINLTVKPGMKQGLFGNASAGYGEKDRYEANLMINYAKNDNQFTFIGSSNNTNNTNFTDLGGSMGDRPSSRGMSFGGRNGILRSSNGGFNFASELSSKFKLGGNVRYGNSDNQVVSNSYTQNYISSGDQYETRSQSGNNTGDNMRTEFRMEWTPSENTRLIFTPNISYTKNTNRQSSDYLTTLDDINDSINWGYSEYRSKTANTSLNGNLDFSHKFGKKGRTLSFSISGGFSDQNADGANDSRTDYKNSRTRSVITDQIYNTKNNSYNWSGFLSYVEPLGTNNFLQLSYRYRSNLSEQDRRTFKNDGAGDYSIVDTSSTKRLENDFGNQEIRLNFQSVREKYNYTVGVAVQPSNSESKTFEPDTAYTVTNNVVNFSPVVQFIYRWDRQTTLRLNYTGTVNQPSTTQLSSVRDESNPLNITYGNPDLNPSFRNNFRAQFQKSNQDRTTTITSAANFSFTTNAIVSYSLVDSVGKRESTYRTINGNKSGDIRFMINKSLFNRKFSVNSTSNIGYSESNGFINSDLNTTGDLSLGETLGTSYRSDLFDFSLRGNVRYSKTDKSLAGQISSEVFNYGVNANTTIYLPWNLGVNSDLNYSTNSGYSDGFKQNEWLWNASIQKQVFKDKGGTIKFSMYDILHQRSNISRTSGAQSLRYTASNTVGSYFIFSFTYRFRNFKGDQQRRGFRDRNIEDGDIPPEPPVREGGDRMREGGGMRGGFGGGGGI